jgi:hypothetical protein
MQPTGAAAPTQAPKRGLKAIVKSYFYWTYPRGSFHYDVMVTLILLFIAITPRLWNYGEQPLSTTHLSHPIQVTSDGRHGMVVTVMASDINVPADASYAAVKKALRQAIMPVTGDAVFVERWETTKDAQGNLVWTVWAHR